MVIGCLFLGGGCSLLAPSDRELSGGHGARAPTSGRAAGGRAAGGSGAAIGGASSGAAGAALGCQARDSCSGEGGFAGGAAGSKQADGGEPSENGGFGASGRASGGERSVGGAGAGEAGAGPDLCESTLCDVNAACTVRSGRAVCECRSGFRADGNTCVRYTSCLELHQAESALASGVYWMHADDKWGDVRMYCEMEVAGGGWTLALNEDTSFYVLTIGNSDGVVYWTNGVGAAYSTVPVTSDLMFDMSESDISGDAYLARVIVLSVPEGSRDQTLRQLFMGEPSYVDKEDNSNVSLEDAPLGCDALPDDMRQLVCGTPMITLGDRAANCDDPETPFAISGSSANAEPWHDCSGWPSAIAHDGYQHYPRNFRIWVR